jgi:hypothetical protein
VVCWCVFLWRGWLAQLFLLGLSMTFGDTPWSRMSTCVSRESNRFGWKVFLCFFFFSFFSFFFFLLK